MGNLQLRADGTSYITELLLRGAIFEEVDSKKKAES